jgi:hypothetical protein
MLADNPYSKQPNDKEAVAHNFIDSAPRLTYVDESFDTPQD